MKVGVIGMGGIGVKHALGIQSFSIVDQVIGCDLSPEMRANAEEKGITDTVEGLEQLLALEPDAVFVITDPGSHAMLIRPCLERGIPVFTEKPLSTDNEEGRALVALAAEKNVNFQVGFELRYCGVNQGMHEIVDSGLVGEPLHMDLVQISGHHPKPGKMAKARTGGIFYEKLCHQVDFYRHWFGEPEAILAIAGPQALKHYEVHDNVHANLKFADGKTGGITFLTTRAAHIGGTSDHGDRGHFYEWILTCSKGSLTYDGWSEHLEVVRFNHRDDLKSELVESIDVRKRWGEPSYDLKSEDLDFLENVKAGKPCRFPASDAQQSMEWVEKGEESLRKGGMWIS